MPTFLENIDLLTVDQHVYVDTDEGKKLVTRVALLTQLRNAVSGGIEVLGASAPMGSRPTIDGGAYDLLDEIDRQAAGVLSQVDSRPTPLGTTGHYVRLWSAAAREEQMFTVEIPHQHDEKITAGLYTQWIEGGRVGIPPKGSYFKSETFSAHALAQRWVDHIELFFNPPYTREIQGACPSCDTKKMRRTKDGRVLQNYALQFVHDKDGKTTEARCTACKAVWYPFQFDWLAKAIGAKPLPELTPTPTTQGLPLGETS